MCPDGSDACFKHVIKNIAISNQLKCVALNNIDSTIKLRITQYFCLFWENMFFEYSEKYKCVSVCLACFGLYIDVLSVSMRFNVIVCRYEHISTYVCGVVRTCRKNFHEGIQFENKKERQKGIQFDMSSILCNSTQINKNNILNEKLRQLNLI